MPSNLPSLNALRAFDAVARELSYKAAAERLNVSPAAVKQLVAKLEDTLAVKLLRRKGQGLALTDAGKAGVDRLGEGFTALEQAVTLIRAATVQTERLVISAEPFFAQSWLVPRLSGFRQARPGVDVLIDSSLEIKDLNGEGIDGAIRYGVPSTDPSRTTRLFGDAVMPLCSPSLLPDRPTGTVADLSGRTFIHWDLQPAPWARQTARWFSFDYFWKTAQLGTFEPAHNIYFSDYNLGIQAALAGQGVVLGSLPILREIVDQGMLVPALPVQLETDIGYDFVSTSEPLPGSPIEQFRAWLVAEAQALRGV